MALSTRTCWLLAAGLALGCGAPSASAGWISITNDTPEALVVQESVNPFLLLRRPQKWRLLPGEAMREQRKCGTEMKVQIFDARCPTKPILKGTLTWKAEDVALKFVPADAEVAVTFTGPAAPAPSKSAAPFVPTDR